MTSELQAQVSGLDHAEPGRRCGARLLRRAAVDGRRAAARLVALAAAAGVLAAARRRLRSPGAAGGSGRRIAIFGSSVASGTGDESGRSGYAGLLRDLLQPRGWEVVNQSRGGDNTAEADVAVRSGGQARSRARDTSFRLAPATW